MRASIKKIVYPFAINKSHLFIFCLTIFVGLNNSKKFINKIDNYLGDSQAINSLKVIDKILNINC